MKLQLDTINKTITIEGNVNLKEMFKTIKTLLPEGAWEEFSLQQVATIQYFEKPIFIEKNPYQKRYDWYCATPDDNKVLCLAKGTYNIEAEL